MSALDLGHKRYEYPPPWLAVIAKAALKMLVASAGVRLAGWRSQLLERRISSVSHGQATELGRECSVSMLKKRTKLSALCVLLAKSRLRWGAQPAKTVNRAGFQWSMAHANALYVHRDISVKPRGKRNVHPVQVESTRQVVTMPPLAKSAQQENMRRKQVQHIATAVLLTQRPSKTPLPKATAFVKKVFLT